MKRGYVLPLAVMIIAVMVTLTTRLFDRSRVQIAYGSYIVDRVQASELALNGVTIARRLITQVYEHPSDDKKNTQKKESSDQEIYAQLLPLLGSWKKYTIQEKQGKLQGTVQICITCEDGKININKLFDWGKKKWRALPETAANKQAPRAETDKTYKTLMQKTGTQIARLAHTKKTLFDNLTEFFTKRGYPLNDVTDILNQPAIGNWSEYIFFEPLEGKNARDYTNRPIYLNDIFTIWTSHAGANPWVLSDGMRALIGAHRIDAHKFDTAAIKKVVKNFKKNITLATDWDTTVKPLYGISYGPKIASEAPFIESEYSISAFCVLSYATVGRCTQRLCAIITRAASSNSSDEPQWTIARIYWLT